MLALWTYLYATTQLAMPLAPERTVLVPLAHDEPMLRFGLTRGLVRMAAGLAFMTPEERRLVDDLHGLGDRPEADRGRRASSRPRRGTPPAPARAQDLPGRFALYLGRVDPAKGLDALVRAHGAYRDAGGELGLVLAGRPTVEMRLPGWVRTTGFVDAATRSDLLDACEVVVLPSPHESLSLVALEAWRAGRPTLATGRSDVLAGQTARSGGGLLYLDAPTYARQLTRLAADPALRAGLAAAGRGLGGRPHLGRLRPPLARAARAGAPPAQPAQPAQPGLRPAGPQESISPVVRCHERSVAQAITRPAKRPAGSSRRATWRGVGRVPSNHWSVATRIVAESIEGRAKWPISSRMKPAVEGPMPVSESSDA